MEQLDLSYNNFTEKALAIPARANALCLRSGMRTDLESWQPLVNTQILTRLVRLNATWIECDTDHVAEFATWRHRMNDPRELEALLRACKDATIEL